MDPFKKQLDDLMGDTSLQESHIKKRVKEDLTLRKTQRSWHVQAVTAAVAAVAVFLFMTAVPFTQNSANEGRGVPYDPLDDLAQIATLQKTKKLSTIHYESFAQLPVLDRLTDLQYVDNEEFTFAGKEGLYHTVIERQENLFDEAVYEAGDAVRTMTNTSSHLPIYENAYYEVIAVPGDRVVLQNGKLTVNGKPVKSELMELYEENGNTIAGGYDQLLNAREYFLVNHFPAENTLQAGAITAVHKIYGQVVGLAEENTTESIYFGLANDYTPEQYFDLYLYDQIFGDGMISERLSAGDISFPYVNRLGELFLEASYRSVTYVSETEVDIRYQYGREGVGEYKFKMYKDPAGFWQWGL
ncbi:S26 family signal peptidase [Solibacillus silvestris]|uniref:S26 family signal peptidase n=1 Tax=Solibacillus silvestris TaxID=76853 RepID=UPI003F815553